VDAGWLGKKSRPTADREAAGEWRAGLNKTANTYVIEIAL